MNLSKTLIILICCLTASVSFAQKQQLKKANGFYKLNQYKDAIALYEEALKQKDNLSASTKLAYCYRMTNQMAKAEEWYAKVVANEKAKPITYFYYAESLMSNSKYDLAKNWFLKYNEKNPKDKNAIRMAYACDKVKTLEPYFKNVDVQDFEHNSDADESSPVQTGGGIVFVSDRSSGINPLKQKSGWTGRDYQRIYYSAEKEENSYGSPVNFSKKLNDINKHCGPVSFTADKKTVIFTRTGQTAGRDNSYNIQLYSAESEDGKRWKNVKLLSFCSKEHNYMHPAVSPDGSKLFFVSDKPGGLGGTDIYLCQRKGEGWGKPQNLGPIINTPVNEAFPFYHQSDKLFFCSKGHLSFGGFDILFSNLKENGSWQKPVNVGRPINSSYDDISISLDQSMESGMFASSRNGGDDDIYIFKIIEGINAELESLDFEGLVDKEVVVEPEIEEENPPVIEPMEKVNTIVDAAVKTGLEEEPVKNIEPAIHNNESLEEVKEEEETELATVSEPVIKPAKMDATLEVKEKVEPVMEEIIEEPITDPISSSNEMPDRKVSILDAPPMEEEMVMEEEVVMKEEPIRSVPVSREVTTEDLPKTKEKKLKSKKKNTKASKQVNLIIPSKKKISEPIDDSKNEIIESSPKVEEPKVEIETTPVPIEEKVKGTVIPVKEEVSSIPSSILDRESAESNPPVLLGGESSMLAEDVEELPRLAELLQTNQSIPKQGFIVPGLAYPTGSYLLSPEGTKSLAAVVDLMKLYPDLKIEISSHTSSLGDDVDNHNLSRKRAMSIMAFLIYKGVDNERVTAKGYGETQLLNTCSNGIDCPRTEHLKNDRIQLKVVE